MFFKAFLSLDPRIREKVAVIILLVGMLGPGIALLAAPGVWGQSALFLQLRSLPIPLQVYGVILVVASLIVVGSTKIKKFVEWRDTAFMATALFYLVANISGAVAILRGQANSALIFALPVLLWLYVEASMTASRVASGLSYTQIQDPVASAFSPESTDREE